MSFKLKLRQVQDRRTKGWVGWADTGSSTRADRRQAISERIGKKEAAPYSTEVRLRGK